MTAISSDDLKLRAARWRQVLSAQPRSYFVFLLTREGRYLELRVPNSKRLWKSREAHLGKTLEQVLPPELAEPRRFYFDRAVETGFPQVFAYPHPYKGKDKYFECEITPLPSEVDGEIREVLMIVKDIIVKEIPDWVYEETA